MIELAVLKNRFFYEPIFPVITEASGLEKDRIPAADQFTQFLQTAATHEPLIFSRIFVTNSIANKLASDFLIQFEDNNEEYIKFASRI